MQVICASYFGRSSDAQYGYQFRTLVELIRIFTINNYATSSRIAKGTQTYILVSQESRRRPTRPVSSDRVGPRKTSHGGRPWRLRHILLGSIAHQARLLFGSVSQRNLFAGKWLHVALAGWRQSGSGSLNSRSLRLFVRAYQRPRQRPQGGGYDVAL